MFCVPVSPPGLRISIANEASAMEKCLLSLSSVSMKSMRIHRVALLSLPFVVCLWRPHLSAAGRSERPIVSVCLLVLPLLALFWNMKHVFPTISKAQPNSSE